MLYLSEDGVSDSLCNKQCVWYTAACNIGQQVTVIVDVTTGNSESGCNTG